MAESNPREETASGGGAHEEDGIPIDKLMGRIKGLMLDTDANGFPWSEPSDAPSLAEKPKRDLLTGKRFAGLRDEPWKISLAVEMVLFARSDDVSPGGTWPYEKFQDRLEAQGHFLPDGLSIQDAVNIVEGDLLRMSPATPKKPAWYEANIEIPMHKRRTSGLMGATSRDEGEFLQDSALWLKPSARDEEIEYAVITYHDIQRAPSILATRLEQLEDRVASQKSQSALASKADHQRITALRVALELSRDVASAIPSREAMHVWIRNATDGGLDLEFEPRQWAEAPSPLLSDAAVRIVDTDLSSQESDSLCRLAADNYKQALRGHSDSPG